MIGVFVTGVRMGWREIGAHPGRSLLTISGVVLGVAALVTTISIVTGMFSSWDARMRESGGVEKFSISPAAPPSEQEDIEHRSPGLTSDDARVIAEVCGPLDGISPEAEERRASLRRGGLRYNSRVRGVVADYFRLHHYQASEGRLFSPYDVKAASAVVVLSAQARSRLFPDQARAVGETVIIRGQPFVVVGVLRDYMANMRGGRGNWRFYYWKNSGSYVPLTAFQRRIRGQQEGKPWNAIDDMDVRVPAVEDLHHVVRQVENTLVAMHAGIHDFEIETKEEDIERLNESRSTYMAALGGVGAVSLLVGGLGIMNVMLASISDRLREIGIRKAVGAGDMDIFIQVVVEAATLSVLGGFIGVALSIGLVDFLQDWLDESRLRPELSSSALLFGFGFSVFVGVVSGIYPAVKAARLDPIEALRYE